MPDYGCVAYAELLSHISPRVTRSHSFTETEDRVLRKGIRTESASRSSLLGHVALIVGDRSDEQVVGIEASSNVAVVKDTQIRLHVEAKPKPCGSSMNENMTSPAGDRRLSIAAGCGFGPEPTSGGGDFSVGQKTLFHNSSWFHKMDSSDGS